MSKPTKPITIPSLLSAASPLANELPNPFVPQRRHLVPSTIKEHRLLNPMISNSELVHELLTVGLVRNDYIAGSRENLNDQLAVLQLGQF
jgi:hypothetical protein